MRIEDAIELINDMNANELKALGRNELMFIVDGMNVEDRGRFFMEKNIKVFGGINEYTDDFLSKINIGTMNEQGKAGAMALLNKMLAYPGISDINRTRIQNTLMSMNYATAPAAGGKGMRRKTRRSRKGLKRSRVRR